ncbi:hypothetical protein Tco_0853193 [Tanacetum coccineum]
MVKSPLKKTSIKVLRSLSQEWTIHTIVWRNKPEIRTLSLDDLFNNLKAYESEVKGTSRSTTNSHNVAFLSSSSTNSATRAVNTTQGVNTASTQDAGNSLTTVENLSDVVISSSLLANNVMALAMTRVTKHKKVQPISLSWLILQEVLVLLKTLSLDDFVEVNESVVEKPTVETNEPKNARKENGAPIIKDWVSESEEENVPKVKKVEMFNKPSFAKINFVKSTEQVKSPRKTSVDKNRQNTPSPRGNKRNWNQQMS